MDEFNETNNSTIDDDDDCSGNELAHTRKYLDFTCSLIGFMLSTVHLIILIYIRFWQKHKGFFLLLAQVSFQ